MTLDNQTCNYSDSLAVAYQGDALVVLADLPADSVDCIVTSPPYWQLLSYGIEGELGAERQPKDYVARLVAIMGEAKRLLRKGGALWINIGDSYAASGKGGGGTAVDRANWTGIVARKGWRSPPAGFKKKDLTLTPFAVASGLREDGWYLRSTIVWAKASATEPPRLDRPSVSHEYLFLLSKSEDYLVRDPGASWWNTSVWQITSGTSTDHPGVMPDELAKRCIEASSRPGDTILDPFAGSGTTLAVAKRLGRRSIGVELNQGYMALLAKRVGRATYEPGLFEATA